MPLTRFFMDRMGLPVSPVEEISPPLTQAPVLAPRRGLSRAAIFSALLVGLDTLTFACAYLGFLRLRMITVGDPGLPNLWPLWRFAWGRFT